MAETPGEYDPFAAWEQELNADPGARWRRLGMRVRYFMRLPVEPKKRREAIRERLLATGLIALVGSVLFYVGKSVEIAPEETALRRAYWDTSVLATFGICEAELAAQLRYDDRRLTKLMRGRLHFIRGGAELARTKQIPCTPAVGSPHTYEFSFGNQRLTLTPEMLTVFDATKACAVIRGQAPAISEDQALQHEYVRLNQELAITTHQPC